MSPARRARILALYDGKCYRCGSTERLEIDHAICLELGGQDADFNCVALCHDHHLAKTRLDRRLIAKAHRLIRKADPETRKKTKRPLSGRGFDKTRTRGFDGKVRPRA